MNIDKKIELLAPAGDFEKLKVALAYGADAVYMAGKSFGMRARAKNFESDEMAQSIAYAHRLGKKVYVTCNIFAHNSDLLGAEAYFRELEAMGADALIISDLGLFSLAKKVVPNMEIHISTQANSTNHASVSFWHELGANRVVLARELSIGEITDIHAHAPHVELEAFVHGAMCMAYSGRCLLSNYMSDRDSNRGECSQPCRWSYSVVERATGQAYDIEETEGRGTQLFSSKDLCMIQHLPAVLESGITSLKIEGRMKTAYYVATVTKTYRQAIDDYLADPARYESRIPHYQAQLEKVKHRDFTTGFFFGPITNEDHIYRGQSNARIHDFLAIVLSYDATTGYALVEQRNKFELGENIELFRANGEITPLVLTDMTDEAGEPIESAPHPLQKIRIKLDTSVSEFDIIRKPN